MSNSGTLQFDRTCTAKELSGTSWAGKFPDSKNISDLSGAFQTDVINFIDAMTQAGIAERTISTLRLAEKAYLIHFGWLVAKGQLSAQNVPAFVPSAGQAPVNICWVHTDSSGNYDATASAAAAQAMINAIGVDPTLKTAPALHTRHTEGLAIDMATTWSAATITINDASGNPVTINTTPHSGLNAQLMAVGLTYGVHHFCYPPGTCTTKVPSNDRYHWSSDGH